MARVLAARARDSSPEAKCFFTWCHLVSGPERRLFMVCEQRARNALQAQGTGYFRTLSPYMATVLGYEPVPLALSLA